MRKTIACGMVVMALALLAPPAWVPVGAGSSNGAKGAYERLRGLAGRWEATTAGGTAVATYEVVAGGTGILERFTDPRHRDQGQMITLYYLEGDRLALTHYCIAGNQPRMVAEPNSSEPDVLRFELSGITNLSDPNGGHMRRAVITFRDRDRFLTEWSFFEGGRNTFTERLEFRRVG